MARLFDDAQSEYLLLADGPIASPCALAAWAKSDNVTARQDVLTLGNTGGPHTVVLSLQGDVGGDPIRCAAYDGGTAASAPTSTGYSANTWHHLLGIQYADDSVAAYIDGGSKGSDATQTDPLVFDRTAIGGHYYSGGMVAGQYMSGAIAEAAIWDLSGWTVSVFEANVVPALAAGVSPLFFPLGLVAFWPLGGLNGRHDRDIWGGYDMTPYNTPSWADHPGGLIYPSGVIVPATAAAAPPGVVVSPYYYQQLLAG